MYTDCYDASLSRHRQLCRTFLLAVAVWVCAVVCALNEVMRDSQEYQHAFSSLCA
jgi:hypothetical protein